MTGVWFVLALSAAGTIAREGVTVLMTTHEVELAREFADRNIRCLSISPGPINTNFQTASGSPPEFMTRAVADVPMKRAGEPEEIGELVLFMCSDACQYMTANTVYVNGEIGRAHV